MTRRDDDCLSVSEGTMTIDAAAALIAERFSVAAGTERIAIAAADGRVAACDIVAERNVPPFDNAAVDGFAVRLADLSEEGETILPVRGRLAAGQPGSDHEAGTASRIFTGAPMPAGADTVFMQEDVRPEGRNAAFPARPARGANCRKAGEDIACGHVAIPQGRRLRPQDLALAAAIGLADIPVRKRPRVALFSTGDELADPGTDLGPAGIHDSNRVMLAALLGRLGAETRDLGILRDDPAMLAKRLADAAGSHDLVLTSGGVSVGEEDHVKDAIKAVGTLTFWRLAIKPGRPVAMGTVAGTPFVGLPGNPVAAYVTLLFVVRPLLARLGGATHEPARPFPVRAAFAFARKPGRREFLRVNVVHGADGTSTAAQLHRGGSATITSLTGSDGFVELPEAASGVAPGDVLAYYPHALLW